MKKNSTPLSRRKFLQSAGLAGALGSTLGLPLTAPAVVRPKARARNLIFMVADGMSHGTLGAANHWLNLHENRDTHWMQLYRDGLARQALMETRSSSSIVTDSAAASSSWGGGKRIPNGQVNVDENGSDVTPLYSFGRQAGKRLGLVTTATISHATPAGFATNSLSRKDQDFIAEQYLERGVDVLLGGGTRFFTPERRKDGRDLSARYRQAGYTVVKDRTSLAEAPRRGPLLGVFSEDHVPYAIDRRYDTSLAGVPSLAEMTTAALDRLADAPEGFLLQIEGGRVDHAAHNNDPGAILAEMLEFDRCVGQVRAFVEAHPDTLVIVTTDHGTGGFMLNGEGKDYNGSQPCFERLGKVRASYEGLGGRHRRAPLKTSDVLDALGLPAKPEFAEMVTAALADWDGDPKPFGKVLREMLAPWFATSWTTQNHTGELVAFAAYGPGSDAFPGFFENWEVHHRLREGLAI